MEEREQYFAKALESLASAKDDFEAERYNSCARGIYFALFQGAIAALIHEGIRPQGEEWSHEFVQSRFSGLLVYRRKVYSGKFRTLLAQAFNLRRQADYAPEPVRRRAVQPLLSLAEELAELVKERIGWSTKL